MLDSIKLYLLLKYKSVNFLPQILYKKIIELKYKDYYLILVPPALGETTMTCLMAKELKKRQPGKVAIIVNKKSFAEYVNKYDCVDKAIIVSQKFDNFMNSQKYKYSQIKKGKIFNIKNGLNNSKPFYPIVENFFQYYKNLMNIGGDYEYSVLEIDNKRLNELEKKYNLNKPTIMLSPEAKSLNDKILRPAFWYNLSRILQNKGYQVILNSNNKIYGDVKYVYESLYDTILIASKVRCIAAFRSGLLDAFMPNISTKIIALYPTSDYQVYKYLDNKSMMKSVFGVYTNEDFERVVIDGQSLINMFDNHNNTEEISVNKNNIRNLETIISEKIEVA